LTAKKRPGPATRPATHSLRVTMATETPTFLIPKRVLNFILSYVAGEIHSDVDRITKLVVARVSATYQSFRVILLAWIITA
jgi:hypothetical protein